MEIPNDDDVIKIEVSPQLNAQLLCALELAYSEIFRLITTSRIIQYTHTHDSGDVLKTIADAIAAAKGE
jgi:hypothetical protein